MKTFLKALSISFMGLLWLSLNACNDDDSTPVPPRVFTQNDQMARPAVNTVFVSSTQKDQFNVTTPSTMGANFATSFQDNLLALNANYTTNALGQDATIFSNLLATDVLNVALNGTTTFFDGTNVLTGRTLEDDVIDVELLLIFGGPMGTDNTGLISDHVDANDKAFLTTFPYLAAPH